MSRTWTHTSHWHLPGHSVDCWGPDCWDRGTTLRTLRTVRRPGRPAQRELVTRHRDTGWVHDTYGARKKGHSLYQRYAWQRTRTRERVRLRLAVQHAQAGDLEAADMTAPAPEHHRHDTLWALY